jgi:hypothetical protein
MSRYHSSLMVGHGTVEPLREGQGYPQERVDSTTNGGLAQNRWLVTGTTMTHS